MGCPGNSVGDHCCSIRGGHLIPCCLCSVVDVVHSRCIPYLWLLLLFVGIRLSVDLPPAAVSLLLMMFGGIQLLLIHLFVFFFDHWWYSIPVFSILYIYIRVYSITIAFVLMIYSIVVDQWSVICDCYWCHLVDQWWHSIEYSMLIHLLLLLVLLIFIRYPFFHSHLLFFRSFVVIPFDVVVLFGDALFDSGCSTSIYSHSHYIRLQCCYSMVFDLLMCWWVFHSVVFCYLDVLFRYSVDIPFLLLILMVFCCWTFIVIRYSILIDCIPFVVVIRRPVHVFVIVDDTPIVFHSDVVVSISLHSVPWFDSRWFIRFGVRWCCCWFHSCWPGDCCLLLVFVVVVVVDPFLPVVVVVVVLLMLCCCSFVRFRIGVTFFDVVLPSMHSTMKYIHCSMVLLIWCCYILPIHSVLLIRWLTVGDDAQ